MCTCVALEFGRFYFGRNMDLEGSFGEDVVMAPRFFPFILRSGRRVEEHYAILGMAAVVDGYPLFADAMNEEGLCAAGLNFPENAVYCDCASTGKEGIAPFELIPYLLSTCASVDEAEMALRRLVLTDTPFSPKLPLTPLHFMLADRKGALTVEPMADGLHVYRNPVGVLSNNPPFPYHLANLSQYANLSAGVPKASLYRNEGAVGLGMGGHGLPGDYSSASRFVRTAFLKQTATCGQSREEQVDCCFQILSAVAPVKGCVTGDDGAPHYTTYSCCMSPDEKRYYLKRHGKTAIFRAEITAGNCRQKNLNFF